MITIEQMAKLKKGDPVAYGFYRNVFFESASQGMVTMRDSVGDLKTVYESLFLKYASVKKK